MNAFVARGSGVARGIPTEVFGPLADLVAERDVTDVFVNGDGSVWADRGSGAAVVDGRRVAAPVARDLAIRLDTTGRIVTVPAVTYEE